MKTEHKILTESEIHRRIKYAIAKEFVGMGLTAGVEVPRPGGGIIDVYGKKGNSEIYVEIWKTNLPEWLIVRVNQVAIPQALVTGTERNSNVELSVTMPRSRYQVRSQKQRQQLAELDTCSQAEISRLRVFIETFNSLSGRDRMDVDEYDLTRELIKTGEFDDELSVTECITMAMEIGIIYRRKPGLYARSDTTDW